MSGTFERPSVSEHRIPALRTGAMSYYDYDGDPYQYQHRNREQPLPWGVFWLGTSIAFYAGILFVALGIAAGLFYLAELAEEYTTIARRVMKYLVITIASLYVLVAAVDGISWWRCLVSVAGQAGYAQLLRRFPWITPSSPAFLLSVVVFATDHILWYSYFSEVQQSLSTAVPYWSIVSFFFLFVWSVPFGFFVTCAVADQNLPGLGGSSGVAGGGDAAGFAGGVKRRTFATMLSSFLPARVLGEKRT